MKIIKGGFVEHLRFECSGRKIALHVEPIMSLSGNLAAGEISADFPDSHDPDFTIAERQEFAEHMIALWKQWAITGNRNE